MATRTKMTPFAKFFLMLIIVSPIAYLGASYYNGEDGIANIKNFLSRNSKVESVNSNLQQLTREDLIKTIGELEIKVIQLEKRIEELENTQ